MLNYTIVLELADRGFSYRFISRCTGLTRAGIAYILKKNQAKVSTYLNGDNPQARQVLKRLKIFVR